MTDGTNPYAPPPAGGPGQPDYNPYAPPRARLGAGGGAIDGAEAIRHEHLSHEASLRSVGCLYYWGGILMVVGSVAFVATMLFQALQPGSAGSELNTSAGSLLLVGGIAYALLGWLNIWIGKGLRQLDAKVRTALTLLSVIGLIGFPLGTLISAYILYLLHSAKGKRILTEQYRQVVAQTPHLKYRTSLVAWVILIVLIVFVIAVFVLATA